MNAGWFHSNWWPENWWHEGWWQDYGVFGPSTFVLPAIIGSKDPNEPKTEKIVRALTPKVIEGENI